MRRTINNIISVFYTAIRILFYKLIMGYSLESGFIQRFSPDVVLEFNKGSRIKLGRKIRIHSGSKVKVRKGAKLEIGDNVKINYNCIIACHDSISIGKGTEFGPSVYVYDHDHDYKNGLKTNSNEEKFLHNPIRIGKQCWIGANTIILRGTELGDNCVVGAGSVVKGKYKDGSVIIQKRIEEIK